MGMREAFVGITSQVAWQMQARANERAVWFRMEGQLQLIHVRLTPEQARELAHALIIEADVAQYGAPK